jgi:hypothetical protein
MQRMMAVTLIALMPCLFVAEDRAASPQAAAQFSIVLGVHKPSLPSGGDWVVIVTIGAVEKWELSKEMKDERGIDRTFERWREEARDALFKRLRMA